MREKQLETKDHFAIITALWKENMISSLPLPLIPNSEETMMIYRLAETGSATFNNLKYPISDSEFVVFSKLQLDETLIFVKILSKEDLERDYISENKKQTKKRTKSTV